MCDGERTSLPPHEKAGIYPAEIGCSQLFRYWRRRQGGIHWFVFGLVLYVSVVSTSLAIGTQLIDFAFLTAGQNYPSPLKIARISFDSGSGGLYVKQTNIEDIANVTQGTAISADQLTSSNQIANIVDGAAGSIAGQVIRGLNVAALNNEALAKIVESMVAVTARKVAEKVTYCWYACGGTGTQPQTPLRGVSRPLSGTHTVTVELCLL